MTRNLPRARRTILMAMTALLCAACIAPVSAQTQPPARASTGNAATKQVDGAFLRANAAQSRDWPSHGLDYAETRFSQLKQIDAGNVKDLGLVWSYELESKRGVEATPLVVGGVMYVTAGWSIVHAIDVRTGKKLWIFDPKVVRSDMYKGCCEGVNRGVAIYKGKVFVGAFDGRLIAINAATGKKVWEKDTIVDRKRSYTSTGAPRVVNGKVIIGNAGSEFGVRGYVTAYDAETGAQKWRFFTVPGNPAKPFENEAMAKAAKTWDPAAKWWEAGGGGTVWDSMAFDPELNLLYIGTDNGLPWARAKRSPAGGDNLYLTSIVALNADTGKYVWHYQVMPADNSDYSATQQITLADLTIDGKPRKVLMQAPKNGFVFVIDRTDGKFISANNFVPVNWTTGYGKDGRPVETPLYGKGDLREIIPSPGGGHNWQSMSFSSQTGLIYIPAHSLPYKLMDDKNWKWGDPQLGQMQSNTGWNLAQFLDTTQPLSAPFGRLIAWDPLAQKEVWRVEHVAPWNGGTLATAGNLVFQGTGDARFFAFDAKTGTKLWETPTGAGVIAAPITYEVDGKQYVSIAVGWGGIQGMLERYSNRVNPGTVYTFALGGKAKLPDFVEVQQGALLAGVKYDPKDVPAGQALYLSNCIFCHGVPGVDRGGNVPNLGYMHAAFIDNLGAFVFKGPAMTRGMPDFTGRLTPADVEKIKAFIQGTADAIRPTK